MRLKITKHYQSHLTEKPQTDFLAVLYKVLLLAQEGKCK